MIEASRCYLSPLSRALTADPSPLLYSLCCTASNSFSGNPAERPHTPAAVGELRLHRHPFASTPALRAPPLHPVTPPRHPSSVPLYSGPPSPAYGSEFDSFVWSLAGSDDVAHHAQSSPCTSPALTFRSIVAGSKDRPRSYFAQDPAAWLADGAGEWVDKAERAHKSAWSPDSGSRASSVLGTVDGDGYDGDEEDEGQPSDESSFWCLFAAANERATREGRSLDHLDGREPD